jgi:hypothetical protein
VKIVQLKSKKESSVYNNNNKLFGDYAILALNFGCTAECLRLLCVSSVLYSSDACSCSHS